MNINIYEDYKVMIHTSSSHLSEECESIYDNIFVEDENTDIKMINGGRLLELLSKDLNDNYLSEFTIIGDTINIEYFNYNNGENWVHSYTILRDKLKGGD